MEQESLSIKKNKKIEEGFERFKKTNLGKMLENEPEDKLFKFYLERSSLKV